MSESRKSSWNVACWAGNRLSRTKKAAVEAAQTKKKADDLAQQLGYLIVRERNEGVPAAAEADRLVAEITALQAQLEAEAGDGADSSAAATPTPAASEAEAPPTSASETVTGDFKLEG